MVGLIWAQAANGVIGRAGTIPWRLPEEQAHFRAVTWGSTVVMGRRTWESLPATRRPLPGRRNVVLTRDPGWSAAGAVAAISLADALGGATGDVWVIGGADVYAAALPHADRVVVTELRESVEGDTFAPSLGASWRPTRRDPELGWHRSRSGLHYRVITYLPAGWAELAAEHPARTCPA